MKMIRNTMTIMDEMLVTPLTMMMFSTADKQGQESLQLQLTMLPVDHSPPAARIWRRTRTE
jgi:hypothetical protein